ncbi:Pkinase-domain-containing protein [Trametopsis cervina]|nr:Pkinase-domain-containing protein [Trametopsis cervina]
MDPFVSNLQVPDPSAGPSRSQRPSSVQPTTSPAASSNSRKRASHSVVTGREHQDDQPTYRDVYSHPAAIEFAMAHPKRTIPKFGPYLLLRTLGEGEFGKVKLGLHMQWGEEVAVKLIRRGNIDTNVRMSKVEREIEVLRTLKHPNIVRLYDVIETDKYIGIILEYASGGELFDHILAHRYLREKDACKLFCQLISGVWYIHQKKIVHRDLKLENLLLDRNRNVIITDFGFANRFEHRSDDLMQTSCGSPCYAAPELVISDGLYVGSAVDIWSCGVILYAMLAGYLPFDDDPANPDGDNINLLYKYIVNTPLSFPDYISAEARDLLSMMLVPDPARRADLPSIMAHRWLAPGAHIFTKSVDDLEQAAMEQHHQKRLAYQKQMKQAAVDSNANKMTRSQSAAINGTGHHSSRSHRTQPEYLYETSGDQSVYSTSSPASNRRGVSSAIVLPTSPALSVDDDPFAPTPTQEGPSMSLPATSSPIAQANGNGGHIQEEPRARRGSEKKGLPPSAIAPVKMSPDTKRKGGFRHTIQVEYGETDQAQPTETAPVQRSPSVHAAEKNGAPERRVSARKPTPDMEVSSAKPLPITPVGTPHKELPASKTASLDKAEDSTAVVSIEVTSPPVSPPAAEKSHHAQNGTTSSAESGSSARGRHKRGLSMDKMGISKIFGTGAESQSPTNDVVSRTPSGKSSTPRSSSRDTVTASNTNVSRRPSTLQVPTTPSIHSANIDQSLLSPDTASSVKKTRRNTLTVMVEPFRSSIRQRTKGRAVTDTPTAQEVLAGDKERTPVSTAAPTNVPQVPKKEAAPPATPFSARPDFSSVPASTVKANKVMQWFRSKSKGKAPVDLQEESEKPMQASRVQPELSVNPAAGMSSSTVGYGITPTSEKVGRTPWSAHPLRSASANAETPVAERSFAASVLGRVGGGSVPIAKGTIRIHHGAVDTTTITTNPPPVVMKHVKKVLEEMGIEIQLEGDYKYRCVRPKRRKAAGAGSQAANGLTAFTMVGSAASNGVDKRGLPAPPQSHGSFGSSTGGMLRGLLMRRQSSQVSNLAHPDPEGPEAALAAAAPAVDAPGVVTGEPVYGNQSQDQGDEVRFFVELTRLDRLDDTYSLDIRRLKGNLRSYKFLYDTLRERADLQR